MLQLIKKDILIQKVNVWLSVVLVFGFVIAWSNIGPSGLTMSMVLLSYMLVLGASAVGEKNNSDILLVSLPISRIKIVLAKYASIYVFAAYALVINWLVISLIDVTRLPLSTFPITIEAILGAVGIITIISAISIPLMIKFGYIKSRLVTFIMVFALIFGLSSIQSQNLMNTVNRLSYTGFIATLTVAVLLVLVVSIWISLTLFQRREF